MELKCSECGITKDWDPSTKSGPVSPGFVFREVEGEVRTFCTACAPDSEDYLGIEHVIRELEKRDNMGMPKVAPEQWITVGNRDAVVCNVYDKPGPNDAQVQVVYLDDKNLAIEKDAKWTGNRWEFAIEGAEGGYGDKSRSLQHSVGILRGGRKR